MLFTIMVDQASVTLLCILNLTINVADRTHLGMMRHAHWTGLHPLLMVDAGTTPLLGDCYGT